MRRQQHDNMFYRTSQQTVFQLQIAMDDQRPVVVQVGEALRQLRGPPQRVPKAVDRLQCDRRKQAVPNAGWKMLFALHCLAFMHMPSAKGGLTVAAACAASYAPEPPTKHTCTEWLSNTL